MEGWTLVREEVMGLVSGSSCKAVKMRGGVGIQLGE